MELRRIILAAWCMLLTASVALAWRSIDVLLYDGKVYSVQMSDSLAMRFSAQDLMFTSGGSVTLAIPREFLWMMQMSEACVDGDNDDNDDDDDSGDDGPTTSSAVVRPSALFRFEGRRLILGETLENGDFGIYTSGGVPVPVIVSGNIVSLENLVSGIYILRIGKSDFKIVVR